MATLSLYTILIQHHLSFIILYTLSVTSIADRQLFSFGIMIQQLPPTNPQSELHLQLNWATYSYHCNASVYNDSIYLCHVNDISTIRCDYTNYVSPNGRYSLSISNIDLNTSLIIDQISVNMNDNSYYRVDSFCIDEEFNNTAITGYNQIYSTNCTDFNHELEYENVIINSSLSRSSITIYFIDKVTVWINSNEPGLIQNNHITTQNCYSIPILSFGFQIRDDWLLSSHDNNVTLTLYWFDYIVTCIISKPTGYTQNYQTANMGKYFMCSQKDIKFIESNPIHEYKMKINYEDKLYLAISQLLIIDLFGNRYDINFCGPAQYQYWVTGYKQWHLLYCPDQLHSYMYEYEFIKMDLDDTFIKLLYIEFDQILSYPQINSFGIISPAKVIQYGIRTTIVPQSTVYLRLYWNTYLYVCMLDINTTNELYLCDISYCEQPSQTNYQHHFVLTVSMDSRNSFEIDHVFVKDESGYKYNIYRFCQELQSTDTANTLQKCNQFGDLYRYSSARICSPDSECKTNSLLAFIFPVTLFNFDPLDVDANNDDECMLLYDPEYLSNNQSLCQNNWTLFPTDYYYDYYDEYNETINVVNNTKHELDNLSLKEQILPYVVVGSLLLIIILCGTLICCYCYIKRLRRKLEHANSEKSPSIQPQQHSGSKHRDTTQTHTSFRYSTMKKLSAFQLELAKATSMTSRSVLPSVLQPGMKSHVTTESAIAMQQFEGNKSFNVDDELSSSSNSSIHTSESQKLLKDKCYETAEGEEKETKLESAVHLNLEMKNYGSNDDDDDKNEDEKEDMLLDSMLADVMKMESIDPYKIGNENEKKNNENGSDSDNSDDMYDKSESKHEEIMKANTDNGNYINSIENDDENEGLYEDENKIDMIETDDLDIDSDSACDNIIDEYIEELVLQERLDNNDEET